MRQDRSVSRSVVPSSRRGHLLPALLVAAALCLVASACGGDDDDAGSSAPAPATTADQTQPTSPPEDTSSGGSESAADCEALTSAFPGLRSAASSLFNVEDAAAFETFEANIFPTADVIAKIDVFRPHQDVETASFGTIRGGLDSLEGDLIAAGEGRFGDMTRDYNSAGVAAVLGEVCG